MKNKKLIPSLIVDDGDSLPKRGGKYVSMASRRRMEEQRQVEERINWLQRKLDDCNCYCDCNHMCDCDCQDCNC